jgi:hypothetical protein
MPPSWLGRVVPEGLLDAIGRVSEGCGAEACHKGLAERRAFSGNIRFVAFTAERDRRRPWIMRRPRRVFRSDSGRREFEFPSWNLCKKRNLKADTIFGFYSMLLDFNENNRTPADRERLEKLRDEIARRYPDALLDPGKPGTNIPGGPHYRAVARRDFGGHESGGE